MRHATRWLATVWLFSQIVLLGASTASLAVAASAALTEHCECSGTVGTCPMHPRSGPASHKIFKCAMRNNGAADAALIASMWGNGVLPQVVVVHIAAAPVPVHSVRVLPFERSDRPESPPPRA